MNGSPIRLALISRPRHEIRPRADSAAPAAPPRIGLADDPAREQRLGAARVSRPSFEKGTPRKGLGFSRPCAAVASSDLLARSWSGVPDARTRQDRNP